MQTLANTPADSWLTWFFRGLMILIFLILFARLAELQIIKGAYYQNLSQENRVREIAIPAPRGDIIARGGEIIPVNNVFAHLIGYVGEVDPDESQKTDPQCPLKGPRPLGSYIGKSGLQYFYDCQLRGINGQEIIEVDTFGKKIRNLGQKNPVKGEDLKTTIDFKLQNKIVEIIASQKELPPNPKISIVVSDLNNEILALVSTPTFDPNNIKDYITDKNLPLFNRVISGTYPPGSPFKLITSLAALESQKIGDDYLYTDTGVIHVNDFDYANWYFTQYGGREGEIDLTKALARSTDTFFYKLGELTGPQAMADWAIKMGYGKQTGIDLPAEKEGLIPSPYWKERAKGERWFLGNTYHMAIGQGDVLATPLQVNSVTLAFSRHGEICKPHLKQSDPVCTKIDLNRENLAKVIAGMIAACQSGGTGTPFFDFKFSHNPDAQVACKTGTAETYEEGPTHAWFTIFGPVDEPEIVATVLVEHGGEGSKVAAPIARQIFDFYFNP